jgi:hypothetical protein
MCKPPKMQAGALARRSNQNSSLLSLQGVIQNFRDISTWSFLHNSSPYFCLPEMSTTATDLSSPPSTADPHVFTIKAATLKFDTRESLEPYVTPLIENPVEEVYLSGNTYGIEACAYLGEILAKKTSLRVRPFPSLRFLFPLYIPCVVCRPKLTRRSLDLRIFSPRV